MTNRWEVLVAKTGEINKVASRVSALQALSNAEGCDIRDLNVEDRSSSMGTEQIYAVDIRGRHVGEFWPLETPDPGWEERAVERKHRTDTIAALRAHAVNDLTREIARDGITLTNAEADEIGESTISWMRTRLELRVEETDRGVVCTSGHQSTETVGDRQEV